MSTREEGDVTTRRGFLQQLGLGASAVVGVAVAAGAPAPLDGSSAGLVADGVVAPQPDQVAQPVAPPKLEFRNLPNGQIKIDLEGDEGEIPYFVPHGVEKGQMDMYLKNLEGRLAVAVMATCRDGPITSVSYVREFSFDVTPGGVYVVDWNKGR